MVNQTQCDLLPAIRDHDTSCSGLDEGGGLGRSAFCISIWSPRAMITKYPVTGGLNNKSVFDQLWRLELRIAVGMVASSVSLSPGL